MTFRFAVSGRLFGSLVAETSGIERTLGWRPTVDVDQALALTIQAYRDPTHSG